MTSSSVHVSEFIARKAQDVYAYAVDPSHLPEWAPGLLASIECVDGQWIADSPMGRIVVAFAERNDLGVLDHTVTTQDGTTFHNPMRVLPLDGGCEIVFTLRRQPDMTDEELTRDAAAVAADLAALKQLLES